jgi:hypothetical protein
MIRLDVSSETIVILCTRCHYRGIAGHDRAEAWSRGAAHTRAVHPDDPIALTASLRSARNHS